MRQNLKKELKLTTSVVAIILMVSTLAVGYYASTVEPEVPTPTGDVVVPGDWKQASVRGYNNERFVEATSPRNNFTLESTSDPTIFIGHARGAEFACIMIGNYLMWSYEVTVGSYTAIVNLMPGCLVVNEIFVSSLNTTERYVSISVYTHDGTVPAWFTYWDASRLSNNWSGSTAFSLFHGGHLDLDGKRFYIKSVDGPLFLAEMQLMVGTETVTRPIQGIVISCTDDGIIAMVTDSHGYNWILEYNNEILVMRAVFQSETEALAGKFVSIERTYMVQGDTYISTPAKGVFNTGDDWRITDKKVIHMDGSVEPYDPSSLLTTHVTMTDTKSSAFICADIDMDLGFSIDLVGYTVKTYTEPDRYWIFADVVYPLLDENGVPVLEDGKTVHHSTSGYGRYDESTHTIKFEFYVKFGGVSYLYVYTFEKI